MEFYQIFGKPQDIHSKTTKSRKILWRTFLPTFSLIRSENYINSVLIGTRILVRFHKIWFTRATYRIISLNYTILTKEVTLLRNKNLQIQLSDLQMFRGKFPLNKVQHIKTYWTKYNFSISCMNTCIQYINKLANPFFLWKQL